MRVIFPLRQNEGIKMLVYVCDRCAEVKKPESIVAMSFCSVTEPTIDKEYHLCAKCQEFIEHSINPEIKNDNKSNTSM